MIYKKNCPECKKEITYSTKVSLDRSIRLQRMCRSCSSVKSNDNKRIKDLSRYCPRCGKKLNYSSYHAWWWASKKTNQVCVECANAIKKGRKMPDGFSEKISKIVSGKGNPMYGKRHTDETKQLISQRNKRNKSKSGQIVSEFSKRKMRIVASERVKKFGIHSRNFNPEACKFMDSIGHKYKFRHALNGGEFCHSGYFADGYDMKNNIWFEYDEPHHFDSNGNLSKKDLDRMCTIKENLGCRILRYNEKTKEWKWY